MALAMVALLPPGKLSAQGQQGSGSPYSAYGFGELGGNPQAVQSSMGGVGVALADPYATSQANPASYPYLLLPAFEAGLAVRSVRYETEALSANGRNTRLLGFSLGVPFGKGRWGLALGLNPLTNVGYKFNETAAVEGGSVRYQYTGSGGLDRAFIGAGRVLWQSNDTLDRGTKLSVGANLDYYFGKVEEARKAYYPTGSGYYNSSIASTLIVRSPGATVGFQLAGDLIDLAAAKARMQARKARLTAKDQKAEMAWLNAGKDPTERKALALPKGEGEALRFRIGLSAELPASLAARSTSVANNFVVSASGVEFPRDTAQFIDGARGTLELPILLGLGVAVYNHHWMFTAEHKRRDWAQLKVNVEGYDPRTDLRAAASYAMGASYRPAGAGKGNFFGNMIYRAGARYATDYITVNGTSMDVMGFSAGLSLPLTAGSTQSRFNIGAEFGQRGSTENGLLRERYADIYFGISITPERFTDRWFKRRRID